MKNLIQIFIVGMFVAIVAVIVFVRAGQKTQVSGGEQAAAIIKASGSTFGAMVDSLTGGQS